jgi:hypothetical protein
MYIIMWYVPYVHIVVGNISVDVIILVKDIRRIELPLVSAAFRNNRGVDVIIVEVYEGNRPEIIVPEKDTVMKEVGITHI